MNKNLKALCTSAVLIALSTVLSMIKIWQMPLGGSVTLLSMVPVCMVGMLYGFKWGAPACFLYGFIQIFLGGVFSWGLTPVVLISCIMLDYVLAYGVLSVSCILKDKGKFGILWGVMLGCFLRFICHFVSGYVLFASFEVFNSPVLYSIVYNGAYMLPEMIITAIGVFLLCKSRVLEKMLGIK